jgi:hypothetical protein
MSCALSVLLDSAPRAAHGSPSLALCLSVRPGCLTLEGSDILLAVAFRGVCRSGVVDGMLS